MKYIATLLATLMFALPATAHPGRLDNKGCHRVVTRYEHKSGKVDEPGTEHCHNSKTGEPITLDGKEQLADPLQTPTVPNDHGFETNRPTQ
jgi:hypothetical protein